VIGKSPLFFITVVLFFNSGFSEGGKIIPGNWQHWKSGGAQFELELTSKGFSIIVLKESSDIHDIQIYSNNDLNIKKDKYYIVRFKVRSNKKNVSFTSRLGSESDDRNYYYRAIQVDQAGRREAKEIRFNQDGDLIKFLKLYFEFGQLDRNTKIEISDVEITGEK
jgi:hypothetical protein